MRNVILVFVFGCVGCLAAAQTPLTPSATRLLVVTTSGRDAVDGALIRYERQHGKWKSVGRPVPVVVGKAGMAWDPKLARSPGLLVGPVKHEGDNRSPAGIFPLWNTFGFAPTELHRYIMLTPAMECVDDPNSKHYNQVLSRISVAAPDWSSSEKMRTIDGYRWGAIVLYNAQPPVPGNGSCIFLHVWTGPGQGTAGCTAMSERDMKRLVRRLKSGNTLLVQMPAPEYETLRKAWGLP
jgi:zinc D-Ala-D-Ala dipeptidase